MKGVEHSLKLRPTYAQHIHEDDQNEWNQSDECQYVGQDALSRIGTIEQVREAR